MCSTLELWRRRQVVMQTLYSAQDLLLEILLAVGSKNYADIWICKCIIWRPLRKN